MKRIRLLWQLYPTYVLITIIAMIAVSWYINKALRSYYLEQLANEMLDRAALIETMIAPAFDPQQPELIQTLINDIEEKTDNRITVLLPDGRIIGSLYTSALQDEEVIDRALFQEVLNGNTKILKSNNDMDIATPIVQSNDVVGVLLFSITPQSSLDAFSHIIKEIIIGMLVIALIAALLSLYISKKISHPLQEMRLLARAFARGEFGYRLPIAQNEEIGSLAEAMNQMAARLDDRFRTIRQQRNEQEAILGSMVEGVIAIDRDERIISMNEAARKIFQVKYTSYEGRTIQEIIRNTDLHQFVNRTLVSNGPIEGEIVILDQQDHFLQAHGTTLQDAERDKIGAVVVLNDVTRLRKLENIRRDFVANVSHELKTPITSIKGFVETLLDGVNQPKPTLKSEDFIRFLEIISRQTERLNNIIEDLLSLSRIEQDADKTNIDLYDVSMREVVNMVIECCINKAKEKNIAINTNCTNGLVAKLNPQLIEQALINLVDNAIKYSGNKSQIDINVHSNKDEMIIDVTDQGPGIDQNHLDRLFERFYRIDKARSRKMGGTGLGLAIVKHIAQAHDGYVSVTSKIGKGSKFSIHLPQIK